jgi:hypothetical protein
MSSGNGRGAHHPSESEAARKVLCLILDLLAPLALALALELELSSACPFP